MEPGKAPEEETAPLTQAGWRLSGGGSYDKPRVAYWMHSSGERKRERGTAAERLSLGGVAEEGDLKRNLLLEMRWRAQ